MSWDVAIMKADGLASLEDMTEDFEPECLGEADELYAQLGDFFAGLEWSSPGAGLYEKEELSIEAIVEEEGAVETILLHVHGSGDAVSVIVALCKEFGWQALDCSMSELIDLENPSAEGWEGFRDLRDRVADDLGDEIVEE